MNISCNENQEKNYICSALVCFGRTSEKRARIGIGGGPLRGFSPIAFPLYSVYRGTTRDRY